MQVFIDKLKKRIRFPFILAIVAAFFASAGIDPATMTDWVKLKAALLAFIANPYVIGLFVVAVYGIWNNNTVPGTKDE